MARFKDHHWNCGTKGKVTQAQAQLAVLMDLRDELKDLNRQMKKLARGSRHNHDGDGNGKGRK